MQIKRGYQGGLFIVFRDEHEATKWEWLFWKILRRRWDCFGGYFNAFRLTR
jgi:hypothetical protein